MRIDFSLTLPPRLAAAVLLLVAAGLLTLLIGPWALYGMFATVVLLNVSSPGRGP